VNCHYFLHLHLFDSTFVFLCCFLLASHYLIFTLCSMPLTTPLMLAFYVKCLMHLFPVQSNHFLMQIFLDCSEDEGNKLPNISIQFSPLSASYLRRLMFINKWTVFWKPKTLL
jgi:hypothetical protein